MPKPRKAKSKAAGKSKPAQKPEDADCSDGFLEALSAPREWPPPSVAAQLMEQAEKREPGFTERAKNELRRRRTVPLPTLMRQNNENGPSPGDPEELENVLEEAGFNTPAHLHMELEYYRSRPKELPEARRRELCAQEHDSALRMREADPSLPPVPGFVDNPVVDEKNLCQWCLDARAGGLGHRARDLPGLADVKADVGADSLPASGETSEDDVEDDGQSFDVRDGMNGQELFRLYGTRLQGKSRYKALWKVLNAHPKIRHRKLSGVLWIHRGDWADYIEKLEQAAKAGAAAVLKKGLLWRCPKCRRTYTDKPDLDSCPQCGNDLEPVTSPDRKSVV